MRTLDTGKSVLVIRDTGNIEESIVEIPYAWGLQGPQGAWFVLQPAPGVSKRDIAAAKHCIRRDHDVVSLKVDRIGKVG